MRLNRLVRNYCIAVLLHVTLKAANEYVFEFVTNDHSESDNRAHVNEISGA